MEFDIQYAKRITDKEAHRLDQFMQPPLEGRRYLRNLEQAIRFAILKKKEKEPIRREYYHKLERLKYTRAIMYFNQASKRIDAEIMERLCCVKGGIGTPSLNTGEMVVTKEQAAKLAQVFDTRPTTHIGEISAADIKQQILQPIKPLQQ